MKVSYRWLSEYVDIQDYTAVELADKLTSAGIEVDGIERRNKGVDHVVVGLVTECTQHPDADKLRVCRVDAGQDELLQIVCGAANVAAGQKVPVALVGAVLPDNFKIKKAKLRGVESQGMICSAKELGMNDRLLSKSAQEGILVLPEYCEIGASVVDILDLDDEILELDLTPNRSDCLSMLGVAYEIAAILEREVKLPEAAMPASSLKAADHIKVKIAAPELCSHYAARYLCNVKIGPAPLWMQNRLMAAGIRPINNVVDITNYCMLEYGQPLHAFDSAKLQNGQIEVRLAKSGEQLETLDQIERRLEDHMLLITDGTKPVGLAGVMGGANSEVTEQTVEILLESAKFSGGSIRRTSRQLGLRSEASLRFEKEVNPEAVVPALNRAAALMAQYAGADVAEGVVEEKLGHIEHVKLRITRDRVNRYLGTKIESAEMLSIMKRLRFEVVEESEETLHVTIPPRRGDITRDVDLIEEIARLYGYDRIPTTLIQGATTIGGLDQEQTIRRAIRQYLSETGLNEAINYTFTHPSSMEQYPGMYPDARPIALAMPMSEERSVLRTSLIPHLLDTAMYNHYRKVDDVAIFELGKAFVTDESSLSRLPNEKQLLAMLWTGVRNPRHWQGKAKQVDFYDLKGVIEGLLAYLGLTNIRFEAAAPQGLHPGRAANIWYDGDAGAILLGQMGQLHPDIQRARDLQDTYVLEIGLEPVYQYADFTINYAPIPRYPAISRDMAVVVEQSVEVGGLLQTARETAGEWLESVQIFDIYTGEKVGASKKSVALSLVYRHQERTLTDEEVSELHVQVVAAIENTYQAELRK